MDIVLHERYVIPDLLTELPNDVLHALVADNVGHGITAKTTSVPFEIIRHPRTEPEIHELPIGKFPAP